MTMKDTNRKLGAILALLVSIGGASCTSSERSAGPNVVLVTIDTLRADRMSVYGYERATTPFLEQLASRATLFENAHSTSSWTAPSMASLFTSLPPRSHGIVTGFVDKRKVLNQERLSDDFDTLAEVLKRRGYQTFGISTNGHLTEATGFAQGFDVLEELDWQSAAEVNEKALLLGDRLQAASPFFLWVHYLDPHWPYEERQPWVDEYRAASPPPTPASDVSEQKADAIETFVDMGLRYDSEIRYVDECLEQLFEALGLGAEELVIVTSDHGEAFFEHGKMGHGHSLFNEEIRIPLLIRLPDQTGARRVQSPVSLLDLYPTILEAVGIDLPSETAGASLLPQLRGRDVEARAAFTELDRGDRKQRSLTLDGWKLYRSEAPTKFERLFDLERDAAEKEDRSASEPGRLREMRRRLTQWEQRWPRFAAPEIDAPLDDEDRERLRALGYLE